MSVFSNLSKPILAVFELKEGLGDRLKRARSNLKLKQSDLSTLGEINRATQISYEAGLTEPNTHYLRRIQPSGLDLPYVLFGSTGQEIARELGSSQHVDWKLMQQCFEDVDFFCLKFAQACPSSYRWQLVERLYTKIVAARAERAADGQALKENGIDMVSKLWEQYGK